MDDKGRHKFSVEVEDVDVGTYGVRVGGVQRASLRAVATAGGVEGEVEFRSVVERGKILLNFDPRGQLIEIVNAAGEVLFSHTFGFLLCRWLRRQRRYPSPIHRGCHCGTWGSR